MNRRVAIAACVALSLCTVTAGAFVGHKWLIDPFLDTMDGHGHVWRVIGNFKGEVKKYDADGRFLGSYGTDGGIPVDDPKAEVTLDGHVYPLSGPGRHVLRNAEGVLLGYADLVPESDDERAAGRQAYLKRMNLDEIVPGGHGSNDSNSGVAIGFFGNKRELTWKLSGLGEARFTRTDNSHVIMHGLSYLVAGQQPNPIQSAAPTFSWTKNAVTRTIAGYGSSAAITLPNGIPVKVELLQSK